MVASSSIFDSGDEFRILDALKKWGALSEKRISELSKLSHRRCSVTLGRLEQARRVKLVENRQWGRSYRITGSGLDHLDVVRKDALLRRGERRYYQVRGGPQRNSGGGDTRSPPLPRQQQQQQQQQQQTPPPTLG